MWFRFFFVGSSKGSQEIMKRGLEAFVGGSELIFGCFNQGLDASVGDATGLVLGKIDVDGDIFEGRATTRNALVPWLRVDGPRRNHRGWLVSKEEVVQGGDSMSTLDDCETEVAIASVDDAEQPPSLLDLHATSEWQRNATSGAEGDDISHGLKVKPGHHIEDVLHIEGRALSADVDRKVLAEEIAEIIHVVRRRGDGNLIVCNDFHRMEGHLPSVGAVPGDDFANRADRLTVGNLAFCHEVVLRHCFLRKGLHGVKQDRNGRLVKPNDLSRRAITQDLILHADPTVWVMEDLPDVGLAGVDLWRHEGATEATPFHEEWQHTEGCARLKEAGRGEMPDRPIRGVTTRETYLSNVEITIARPAHSGRGAAVPTFENAHRNLLIRQDPSP